MCSASVVRGPSDRTVDLCGAGKGGNSSSLDNSGMGERELPNLCLVLDGGGSLVGMGVVLEVVVVEVLMYWCLYMMCSIVCNVSERNRVPYLFLAHPVAICKAVSLKGRLLSVSIMSS